MRSKVVPLRIEDCGLRIAESAPQICLRAFLPFSPTFALFMAVALIVRHTGVAYSADEVQSLHAIARSVQPKVVKLYGAGGFQGLESYQSGLLVSDEGHVLTVWSYVLDADDIVVVLDDGRRFTAKHVAADPLTEIALLKFDPGPEKLPHFDLSAAVTAEPGTRVLAFSNLFGIATGDEPVSMLHGVISALAPLDARRGAFATNFRGEVYVIDAAANNPGAAGGALTDSQGRLLGMLGKELRSGITGTWLNYALPVAAFESTVSDMQAGRFTPSEMTDLDRPDEPQSLAGLGIILVPDVVTRTPPYVDRVIPDSPAARAGLQTDDLLVTINAQVAASCRDATKLVERLESDAPVQVAVLRDSEFLEFTLSSEQDDSEEATEADAAEAPAEDDNE
jgi:S1-C subfamily serine protease